MPGGWWCECMKDELPRCEWVNDAECDSGLGPALPRKLSLRELGGEGRSECRENVSRGIESRSVSYGEWACREPDDGGSTARGGAS